jgi:hypothetical protein
VAYSTILFYYILPFKRGGTERGKEGGGDRENKGRGIERVGKRRRLTLCILREKEREREMTFYLVYF